MGVEQILEQMLATKTYSPRLFWYEIRNVLLKNERRGRLDRKAADQAIRSVSIMPIDFIDVQDEPRLLHLARRHRLSIYDASYLAVAVSKQASLATFDIDLAKAARAEGVALIEA